MSDNLTKIRFILNPEDWHSTPAERLWAEPIDSPESRFFRLLNSPFYAQGVSLDDIVRAEEAADGTGLEYAGTVQASGHSTIWLLAPPSSSEFASNWEHLHSRGCSYESTSMHTEAGDQTLYSVDVPPEANLDEIVSILEEGHRRGAWLWQIPHKGHRPLPSSRPSSLA